MFRILLLHRVAAVPNGESRVHVACSVVVRHVAVLGESRQAVLLVPAELLLTGTLHGICLAVMSGFSFDVSLLEITI